MKVLPLDTSSFRQIRERNLIYVDKTPWIYRLLTEGQCYFLARPRRFGKSLTVNTLKELFRGNRELFQELYLYDKWEFREHPVLIFDFNGISHEDPVTFVKSLNWRLKREAEAYGLEFPGAQSPKENLGALIETLYRRFKVRVVVLVDEYDKPILDHLGLGEERLKIAKANQEILKNFFSVLKDTGVVDELGFVFVTGVSYFTKVSVFSEWNNLIDLTTHPKFADFLGYTEEELESNFSEHLDRLCEEKGFASRKECLSEIRYWYNGYRFSPERDIRVYNPISLMYCLDQRSFKNFWFQTATPTFLVNLLKDKFHLVPEIESLRVDADFLKAYDLEDLPVEVLLYQAGYLTIREADEETWWLSYPNREVKRSFERVLFLRLLEVPVGARALADDLGKALYKERWEEVKRLLDELLAQIPHTLYDRADERFFHMVFYLALNLLGYRVEAEVLNHRGRLDMAVKYPGKVFVFEFKAGGTAEEALTQIREKGYTERYERHGMKVIAVGVVFDPKRRAISDLRVKVS